MQKTETVNGEGKTADAVVQFTPFAIKNMGLIQGRTILKVDTYGLACVPYQSSMRQAVLVGAFSKEEIVFFQRFKNAIAGLSLVFQRPDSREPLKIFCRCQIIGMGMMKGRESVAMIILGWKPIPPALAVVLQEQIALNERLQIRYKEIREKRIPILPATVKSMGFNNYALMISGGLQTKCALFSISASFLEFLVPLSSPDFPPGTEASFSLFFLAYRFTVPGKVVSSIRLPTGVQRLGASISYSPELVHILEGYFNAKA